MAQVSGMAGAGIQITYRRLELEKEEALCFDLPDQSLFFFFLFLNLI